MSHPKVPTDVRNLTPGDSVTDTATVRCVRYQPDGRTPLLSLEFANALGGSECFLTPTSEDSSALTYGTKTYTRFTPHTGRLAGWAYVALTDIPMVGFGPVDKSDLEIAMRKHNSALASILNSPTLNPRLFLITLIWLALNAEMMQGYSAIAIAGARDVFQKEVSQLPGQDGALLRRVARELGWEDPN